MNLLATGLVLLAVGYAIWIGVAYFVAWWHVEGR